MGTRFVEVPVAAVLGMLADVRVGVEARGERLVETVVGRERVFEIHRSGGGVVRLFTSAAKGAESLRGCDADAVRVVPGVLYSKPGEEPRFRPTAKAQKILRTAPKDMTDEERVAAFVGRVREALRVAYKRAKVIPCPKCGAPMSVRTTKDKSRQFLGCLAWPGCSFTTPLPATVTA